MNVIIESVGSITPGSTLPSGAPIGALVGKTGVIVGNSSTYNSSLLVDVEGIVYDIHDQYIQVIDKPE